MQDWVLLVAALINLATALINYRNSGRKNQKGTKRRDRRNR